MRKLILILLIMTMCGCCLCVAAEEDPVKKEIPVLGLTFTYPQAMTGARGAISMGSAAELGDGIYYDYLIYCAMTEDEYLKAIEEDPEVIEGKVTALFYVFAVAEGKDFSAVTALIGDSISPEKVMEFGRADDWTYYLYMEENDGFADTMDKEFKDEFAALRGMKDEIAAAFSFSVPFNEYGKMDGKTVSFTATDLDGNEVTSAGIFAQHEVTMVNIWATWCGPCVGELAELQEIHTRFLGKDCAVLGLLIDNDTEAARSLMESNGVTYQVLIAPDNFGSIFPYSAVPTSFFVDRNGAFLGSKIVGAQPDLYEDALEPLLKK